MVDAMAERYSMLPTHILKDATTLDMIVFDVAMSYRHHANKQKNTDYVPPVDQAELEELMRKHKEKYG